MRSQVTRKFIFTAPAEPSRFASSVTMLQGYKASGRSYATYIFLHDLPPSLRLFPTDEKKERWRNKSRKCEGVVELTGCRPSFPPGRWWNRIGLC
jgi:hypothetical protein